VFLQVDDVDSRKNDVDSSERVASRAIDVCVAPEDVPDSSVDDVVSTKNDVDL
jgi:hypothetical protein